MDRSEEFVTHWTKSHYELHAFVLTLIPNRADADEIVHKASIVLWRKFDQFQSGTSFIAWACGVARLEALNFRKTKGRDRLCFAPELMDALADTRLALGDELSERREALELCRGKLVGRDRELLDGYYNVGKPTIKHVADQLGRPENTVCKALIRIRRALLECIERRIRSDSSGGLAGSAYE